MKFPLISTATLAVWLAASPCVADEKADASSQTQASGSTHQTSETSGSAKTERKTSEIMFGQMMAIQAQLGLRRGSAEDTREMRASAKTQAEALATEAQAVLGADATPQEIREFFRARMAGYKTVADMNQDIAAVLGPNPNHGAVKTYLLLRRAEMEGLSGRKTDFEALRAEVKALGDVKVGELRGLLREKVRASVEQHDADKKDKDEDDADTPDHKKREDRKEEHKAEHKEQKEERAEARQEKLEANLEAKVEAKLHELEANTEAKLEKLETQQEKINAKIEAKREEIQTKAEERKEEMEAKRQKIEAKAEAREKTEVQIGHDKKKEGK